MNPAERDNEMNPRFRPATLALVSALSLAAGFGMPAGAADAASAAKPSASPAQTTLPVYTVKGAIGSAQGVSLDAVVEAVRQTVLAAQVPGAIVGLQVKAGDVVRAGQPLVRIDAQAAQQGVTASVAQVEAARAQLHVAAQDFERQKQLFAKQYISQAALERAEAQWQAAQAQVNALQAQAQAARTQSGFFVLSAPYGGVVSEVPVNLGDMVMPGRALLTLVDPSALRITVAVPQSLLPALADGGKGVRFEIPGMTVGEPLAPASVQLLPTVDPATHTAQLRLGLPAGLKGLAPGMFARVFLPAGPAVAQGAERLLVPAKSVVRRAEMTGLYVLDGQGQPRLRQVRLGQAQGDMVEVLSGVAAGDRVVTDPQAAARR